MKDNLKKNTVNHMGKGLKVYMELVFFITLEWISSKPELAILRFFITFSISISLIGVTNIDSGIRCLVHDSGSLGVPGNSLLNLGLCWQKTLTEFALFSFIFCFYCIPNIKLIWFTNFFTFTNHIFDYRPLIFVQFFFSFFKFSW